MTITHENFDAAYNDVTAGNSQFIIPTYTRCTVITKYTIKKWEKAGRKVIKKDSDGRGFRLASGHKYNYLFAGQLQLVK